ncbi:MAG: hydroxymethylglutaryl-CoA reductase, degradative [Nitrososphaerota archaeon]|nr:hydroxymethylglutaryl-CoA reductase, degradative [Nitrososphaerota archaeon]MDG6966380.1 hydroxymethylglutaryl-CoA reductase, degradative [Nitrososphaerota archaeon]MDG6979415.1 hydroxymethylglutaryl-CoA reductase, degradative [Nitrososphaerota archaeon]MDG7005657.1 hydroxymethylglutaryl-CoA reductase, degradative [Nitrososphaerota archaeon]MDG7021267.1 hydroxymethylglutaryl-CoA reductase, degradative [Nitrososphaerota archaeon]
MSPRVSYRRGDRDIALEKSEQPGFYKLSMPERMKTLQELSGISDEEARTLQNTGGLPAETADKMIENVVGGMTLPLGMAMNFVVNGKDYIVPMALEEPSVVAGASKAAKIARVKGGFKVTNTGPVMIGQIQAVDVPEPKKAKARLLRKKKEILAKANAQDPMLVSLGGGAKDINVKVIRSLKGPMVVSELIVNCGDAMGANAVNTMAEAVSPLVEELTGGKVYLRIISNLADRRLVKATAVFEKEALGGKEVVEGVVYAYAFADADPYRCATHNKGIMNGVVAVALACGQDTRALEAGAHSYASRSGAYKPLSTWKKNRDGDLVGTLEMPMAVGLVGGAARVHPAARANIKILGAKTALELAEVMGAVGLAQNLAALRALAAEGIQRGHMKLHARNVAANTGAQGALADEIAERMIAERKIRFDRAKELFDELSKKRPA